MADATVRELERRLIEAAGPDARTRTLLQLAERHAADFHSREGLRAAREALVIARGRNDAHAVGQALAVATTCHYHRGDYIGAVATGLDAVEAYADGDLAGRARALLSIALALYAVAAHDLAQGVADRAVADALAAGDAEGAAGARDIRGLVLMQSGHFDLARRDFRAAAAVHRAHGRADRLKKSVASLGHTYRKQGTLRERAPAQARMRWLHALRIYRIALALGASEADDAIIGGAMAECECRLGNLEAAQAHIARALERAARVDCRAIQAECHLWESHVLREKGELQGAERACGRACAAAEALVHDEMLADCLRELARVHDAQGRFERASDVEARSRDVRLALEASLALVRKEIGPLWDRYIAERPARAA